MKPSGILSLEELVALDIGLLVQRMGSLEVELDDLLSLANERFGNSDISKRYPIQFTQKIEAVKNVCGLVNYDKVEDLAMCQIRYTYDIRQKFVHGRVISVASDSSGYCISVSKMGVPEKISGRQRLLRETYKIRRSEILTGSQRISQYRESLELLRSAVFSSFKGWPSYRVLPEAEPINSTDFREVPLR